MTEPLDPEIECLAYGAIEAEAKRRKTVAREMLGVSYPDGRTNRYRSPLPGRSGGALGSVLRTQGSEAWRVTDRAAFLDHMRQYEGCVETVYDVQTPAGSITGLTAVDELVVVLGAAASHLLTTRDRVVPDVEKAAIAQSEETGEAAAPGIALVYSPGEMRVLPAKGAIEAVARLVKAGLLNWDGSRALPASDAMVIEEAS